jgi:hypothetical protein
LTTCQVLSEAAKNLQRDGSPVSVLTDSGVENVNDTVDEFLSGGTLRRVLAQVEIVESNSLVEAWWRGLRHQWLYLNTLDTAAAVRRLVTFYVKEYKAVTDLRAKSGVPGEPTCYSTVDGRRISQMAVWLYYSLAEPGRAPRRWPPLGPDDPGDSR